MEKRCGVNNNNAVIEHVFCQQNGQESRQFLKSKRLSPWLSITTSAAARIFFCESFFVHVCIAPPEILCPMCF